MVRVATTTNTDVPMTITVTTVPPHIYMSSHDNPAISVTTTSYSRRLSKRFEHNRQKVVMCRRAVVLSLGLMLIVALVWALLNKYNFLEE